jgi:hypothetical protein
VADLPRAIDHRASVRRGAGVTILFVLLTLIMTWPQAVVIKTHAFDHQDVFFNLWRLRWIAHALSTSPTELFNGNIFEPEPGVLAYSDAMLVEGVLAAPLLWAGVPSVLVHNLMLLGAIVASGVGSFVLARHLTGSAGGAVAAGVIFAFAPYRFEHYMHLELQWTVWSPWAFWALQRTIETASVRFGLLTGLFLALQMTSSVYYGVFLFVLIAAVALLQLLTLRGRRLVRTARALALGAAFAASVSGVYSIPYTAASARVGTRPADQVEANSAEPGDYRVATPTNVLYGALYPGAPERRLFPGILPLLLALAGLLLVPPTIPAIAYLIGLVLAFELSLGAHGLLYPLLYEYIGVFRGLRAPARASAFCLLFLGVLVAYGTAALTATMTTPKRRAVAALICAILLLEYRVGPLPLVAYHNEPPPLYRLLATLPRGIVAEFPIARLEWAPHLDPRFEYMSTFHWMPILNGYSGFYPPSYLRRLARLARFPDEASVASLRRENVRYVIVHDDETFSGWERIPIVERLLFLGLRRLGDFPDGWGVGTVMELK